jgi:hypothetical protein
MNEKPSNRLDLKIIGFRSRFWMISGQETVFRWVSVPKLINHDGLAQMLFYTTYVLTTHKQVVSR